MCVCSPDTQNGIVEIKSVSALYDWAAALTGFIDSPRMLDHKLVLIGHCVGVTALYVTNLFNSVYAMSVIFSCIALSQYQMDKCALPSKL